MFFFLLFFLSRYSHDICAPIAFYAPVPFVSSAPDTSGKVAASAAPGFSSTASTHRKREREGELREGKQETARVRGERPFDRDVVVNVVGRSLNGSE